MCILSVLDEKEAMRREAIFKEYWDGFDPSGIYERNLISDLGIMISKQNKTKFITGYIQ